MSAKLKITNGSGNVFRDIGFGTAEAESLKLRSCLMMRIEDYLKKSGATQAATAKVLGLTTPRFNALLKGKINWVLASFSVIPILVFGLKPGLLPSTASLKGSGMRGSTMELWRMPGLRTISSFRFPVVRHGVCWAL